ncbi:unnamed protein product [Discula destructiva]
MGADRASLGRVLWISISNGEGFPIPVSTSVEDRHDALRSAVAGASTPNGVLEYESYADETIFELLGVLRSKNVAFHLFATVPYCTMDATERRFSSEESLDRLLTEDDMSGPIQMIRTQFKPWE